MVRFKLWLRQPRESSDIQAESSSFDCNAGVSARI